METLNLLFQYYIWTVQVLSTFLGVVALVVFGPYLFFKGIAYALNKSASLWQLK